MVVILLFVEMELNFFVWGGGVSTRPRFIRIASLIAIREPVHHHLQEIISILSSSSFPFWSRNQFVHIPNPISRSAISLGLLEN